MSLSKSLSLSSNRGSEYETSSGGISSPDGNTLKKPNICVSSEYSSPPSDQNPSGLFKNGESSGTKVSVLNGLASRRCQGKKEGTLTSTLKFNRKVTRSHTINGNLFCNNVPRFLLDSPSILSDSLDMSSQRVSKANPTHVPGKITACPSSSKDPFYTSRRKRKCPSESCNQKFLYEDLVSYYPNIQTCECSCCEFLSWKKNCVPQFSVERSGLRNICEGSSTDFLESLLAKSRKSQKRKPLYSENVSSSGQDSSSSESKSPQFRAISNKNFSISIIPEKNTSRNVTQRCLKSLINGLPQNAFEVAERKFTTHPELSAEFSAEKHHQMTPSKDRKKNMVQPVSPVANQVLEKCCTRSHQSTLSTRRMSNYYHSSSDCEAVSESVSGSEDFLRPSQEELSDLEKLGYIRGSTPGVPFLEGLKSDTGLNLPSGSKEVNIIFKIKDGEQSQESQSKQSFVNSEKQKKKCKNLCHQSKLSPLVKGQIKVHGRTSTSKVNGKRNSPVKIFFPSLNKRIIPQSGLSLNIQNEGECMQMKEWINVSVVTSKSPSATEIHHSASNSDYYEKIAPQPGSLSNIQAEEGMKASSQQSSSLGKPVELALEQLSQSQKPCSMKSASYEPISEECEIPYLTIKEPGPEHNAGSLRTVFKLYLVDVYKLMPTARRNYYLFHDLLVHRVDIFGVITSIQKVGMNKYAYKVDDSTGSISCLHNVEMKEEKMENLRKIVSRDESDTMNGDHSYATTINESTPDQFIEREDAISVLQAHLKFRLENSFEELSFKLGDTVRAMGILYDYGGIKNMYLYNICKITDLKEELDRIYQMAVLYYKIYPKFIKGLRT